VRDILEGQVEETLHEIRMALRWASLRLGFGVRTSDQPVQFHAALSMANSQPLSTDPCEIPSGSRQAFAVKRGTRYCFIDDMLKRLNQEIEDADPEFRQGLRI